MLTVPSLVVLASAGIDLLLGVDNDICKDICDMANEIDLIMAYVPVEHCLTEIDELGLWDLFLVQLRSMGDQDPVIVQFKDQLNVALSPHRRLLEDGLEILSPAFIVRDAIAEIFSGMITINGADEAYIGLIARYIEPCPALWTLWLSKKDIMLTPELFLGMLILRRYMEPLRDLHDQVRVDVYEKRAVIEWENAKAVSQC